MNDTLNKTFGEQSGSAKNHLDSVEIQCKQLLVVHEVFHQDLNKLVSEVNILKQKIKKNSHDLKKFYTDKVAPAEDLLVISHESQLNDNKSMQQTMTEIKRENRETGQAIAKTFDKLKLLDKKIGQYN